MAGARSMAVRAIDAARVPNISSSSSSFRRTGVAVSRRPTRLATSFLQPNSLAHGRRRPSSSAPRSGKRRSLVVVGEVAGQYEEGFEDVETQIINYFTYKATRTVLHQLYEMNPPKYRWFYNFLVTNKPTDGKRFLRHLGKEKQDLAERVMITRLHLYGKWIKKLDHAKMYNRISEENLAMMRERLMETVIWPSDDTNTEKIG
ncbi:chaperonin-like RbcX protein 2, chloroplastic [Iris pallida]|uniref:Chaperonin-like RbcX protein 2, chloroplastic n=1 Tax=Iris pallida TaxID=29817 RepID=A0AAX6GHS6_IRIPA|nr:chaperonin-like RbcX protein 2, chloroplastic [Iris pallida]KAJ6843899.1 chaperonin-like RbcX protein 2, chloroplastic [Iris pallida]